MSHLTVHNYHIMGSRILSRSFTVEKWEGEDSEHATMPAAPDGMEVDTERATVQSSTEDLGAVEPDVGASISDDDDSEDEDDPANVAMVPMADMLNARFECENVNCSFSPLDHVLTYY